MGAWGTGSFENDGALDLLDEIVQGSDLKPIWTSLEKINDVGIESYIEAPECEAAIAAAEVVAALRGAPSPALPDEASEWLDAKSPIPVPDVLVDAARRALRRVRNTSELRELWDEGGESALWLASVDDLATRLE